MKTIPVGKKMPFKRLLTRLVLFLIALALVNILYGLIVSRNGYLVWTTDAVLFTKLNYKEALKTDFSKPSWGKWYYVEQDSRINKIYEFVSKGRAPNEYIFQKVRLKYVNLILPYFGLPTYIDESHISKIYIFKVQILENDY